MSNYEVVVVFDGTQSDDQVHALMDRAREILLAAACEITYVDDWGRRRLSYPVKKKTEGYYSIFYVRSAPSTFPTDNIRRFCRNTDGVLRYLVVTVPKLKTEEDVRREEARREAERQAAAEAAQKRAEEQARAHEAAEAAAAAASSSPETAEAQDPAAVDEAPIAANESGDAAAESVIVDESGNGAPVETAESESRES